MIVIGSRNPSVLQSKSLLPTLPNLSYYQISVHGKLLSAGVIHYQFIRIVFILFTVYIYIINLNMIEITLRGEKKNGAD